MSDGAFTHKTAVLIYDRDRGCCFRCGAVCAPWRRGQDWSIHHRRPRGSGGSSLEWVSRAANGVLLCGTGTTGCHGWAESNRTVARELGYLVPLNGTLTSSDVPIMRRDGTWWRLSDDGTMRQVFGGDDGAVVQG